MDRFFRSRSWATEGDFVSKKKKKKNESPLELIQDFRCDKLDSVLLIMTETKVSLVRREETEVPMGPP